MYILQPVIHQTVWGGIRISSMLKIQAENLGHLYLVNGHEEMSSPILNGNDKGKTLHEVFPKIKSIYGMEEFEEFPLTIALVDACENLSIQVHPTDLVAERMEGKRIGKKESWLFLEAPEEEWIYAGCQCISKEEISKAIREEEMEKITSHLSIKQNDFVTVEAGTLHAMTAGSLVYEIEYGSNYTYRFYDYNRRDKNGIKRELHIDKALESIEFNNIPKCTKFEENQWNTEDVYEVRRVRNVEVYENESHTIECVTILAGSGYIEEIEIRSGITILLLPGESLNGLKLKELMVSRLKESVCV